MPNKEPKSILSWFKPQKKAESTTLTTELTAEPSITLQDAMMWDGGSSIVTLLGSDGKSARPRSAIYQKWSLMEANPFVARALRLHVTAALAGEEESGHAVFIETNPTFAKDKKRVELSEQIRDDLQDMLNDIAHPVAYNGLAFGDSFGRVYSKKGLGVIDVDVSEMVRPTLVQPFERGGKTTSYAIFSGQKQIARLSLMQMARLKMPRLTWIPQPSVVQKNFLLSLTEDDIDELPHLPSMAGGSLLYTAEDAYDKLTAALVGLIGLRWIDSIDEQMLSVNLEGMTKDQQKAFLKSIKDMLLSSKQLAERAASGTPIMERVRHIVPVFNEKQLTNIGNAPMGRATGGQITIDDVMFYAKMLSGALGVDMSMLGFADLLSGGMGDGGFFRQSAQVAESSGHLRQALAKFFHHIIDIHCLQKYGVVFHPSERPYRINFYGSISALESEKQTTRLNSANSASMLLTGIGQMAETGFDEDAKKQFLVRQFMLSEEEAALYAKAKPQMDDGQGGFGGDIQEEGFEPEEQPQQLKPKVAFGKKSTDDESDTEDDE